MKIKIFIGAFYCFITVLAFSTGCKKTNLIQDAGLGNKSFADKASLNQTSIAAQNTVSTLAYTKEINYYPAKGGWTNMWTQWNTTQINADFKKIASQGFNTVRIIMQAVTGSFDYPQPSPAELGKLSGMIAMASQNNLKVHLTLFDFWKQYPDINGSQQWVDAVVKPFAGDKRISIIELQNEIEPDSAGTMPWARLAIPYLRSISGGIPITISVYGLNRMQSLVNNLASTPPDFYSYHAYSNNGLLYSDINRAKNLAGNIPLFIGESGYSTYTINKDAPYGLAQNQASQEAFQEYLYRTLVNATKSLVLPFPAPWIYSDFDQSAIPYVTGQEEYFFGMNRLDGTAKPVVQTYRNLLNGGAVNYDFNNGFEQGDGKLPVLWRLYQSQTLGFTATFNRDASVYHTGYASASISNSTQSDKGQASFFLNPLKIVVPKRVYNISAWVKGANVSGGNGISVAWFDSSGTYISQNFSSNAPNGTFGWMQLTISSVAAPDNAAMCEIHLNSQGNTGTVWFDDVMFN